MPIEYVVVSVKLKRVSDGGCIMCCVYICRDRLVKTESIETSLMVMLKRNLRGSALVPSLWCYRRRAQEDVTDLLLWQLG